jgi:peptide/nickel transport system permease protein
LSSYLVRRVLQAALAVVGAVVVMFFLLRLTGDPAQLMVAPDAPASDVERVRHAMGFDRPLPVQLADFLVHAARGDFGLSFQYNLPAFQIVLNALPATIQLAGVALVLSLVVALPAGVVSATRRGSLLDRVAMLLALLGQTVPVFWLGLLLILLFAVDWRLLPASGRDSPLSIVLPAVTLAAFIMARTARLVRSAMLEVLAEEYVRTARSKGLGETSVVWRHALRNALISVVTIVALQLGQLLAGAVVTETVFGWPGMGRVMVQAITARDFPLVQAAVFLTAVAVVLVNLVADLLYGVIDPRIRYS